MKELTNKELIEYYNKVEDFINSLETRKVGI